MNYNWGIVLVTARLVAFPISLPKRKAICVLACYTQFSPGSLVGDNPSRGTRPPGCTMLHLVLSYLHIRPSLLELETGNRGCIVGLRLSDEVDCWVQGERSRKQS